MLDHHHADGQESSLRYCRSRGAKKQYDEEVDRFEISQDGQGVVISKTRWEEKNYRGSDCKTRAFRAKRSLALEGDELDFALEPQGLQAWSGVESS